MADERELAGIWELAGKHLVKSSETVLDSPRRDWTCLSELLSKISESGIAVYLPAAEFEEDGDFLIIAYRAQNSVVVSIPLAKRAGLDPPVYVSENEENAPRHLEFGCTSDWFCVETMWSLVNGGRGVSGHAGKGGRAAKKRILPLCTPLVMAAKTVKLEFLAFGGLAVVCISGKEVYAWAESETAWNLMAGHALVSWDYCTLDDES